MRLYKVVILVNIALGTGYLVGYHWWGQEVIRLNRELAAPRPSGATGPAGERSWTARGIVRTVMTEPGLIFITHEAIPGVMAGMTMGFRVEDRKLLRGLASGDRIEFTLKESNNQLVVAAVRKEGSR
jgi:Cu/Ag efflux protein CusF